MGRNGSREEATEVVAVRVAEGPDQGGQGGAGKKQSHWKFIIRVEPTGSAGQLDMCVRKKRRQG